MKSIILLLLSFLLTACNDSSKTKSSNSSYNTSTYESNEYEASNEDYEANEDGEDEEIGEAQEDGSHTATVDYYNPQTGFSNTYTLDVDVEDGEVTQINFPNGGWLDDSHITPGELDEDGHTTIEGEGGKTYDVQIDD